MGVLSYTYGLNGIEVPEGDEYVVQEIDKQQIQEDIEAIRDKSDIVVANMHWGNEYERLPNEEQKELAQFLADQEVDVVIGHHPHVLQPMEWVEGEEGNETLVYYSLGNFYSGQDHDYTDTGGIATFEVEKNGDEVKITEPNVDFTQVVPGPEDQYTVKPMAEADHPANGGETVPSAQSQTPATGAAVAARTTAPATLIPSFLSLATALSLGDFTGHLKY